GIEPCRQAPEGRRGARGATVVADLPEQFAREGFDDLVVGGAALAARLQLGELLIEAHPGEVPAVAELLRRARSRQRVGHHGAREGAPRGVLVLVHADADVLRDAHVARVAPDLARALGHALAAPGDLRG